MLTLNHVWQLIQHDDYAFSIDLQDAYLHTPIVKHHHHFLHFVWCNVPYQKKVLPFWLATAPRVFKSFPKPISCLCHHKGLHIVIYLDDILVLIHSKQAGKRAHLFLCSLLVRLGLHINFSKSDLCLSQTFCFFRLCWDTVHISVSLPPDKLADFQQLVLSLLWTPHVTVHRVMSFLGKANFCTSGHSQLWCLCHVSQSDMLHIYHSPTQLFSCVHFSLSSLCKLELLAHLQQSLVPLQFPLPDVVIATDATPTHWAFIFRDLGYLYCLVVSGQVPCVRLILPCRSLRLLPSCYIVWPSTCLVRWLPCIWITALLRLTCVIKMVQCLLFFPGWPARYWVWPTSMVLLLSLHTFLSTSMWRQIICPRISCFQSGTLSLRWLRQLFTFGAFQRWTYWHLLIPLNTSIISPWKLHYFWGPWGWMPSAILGLFS